jgi:hypothetical protein
MRPACLRVGAIVAVSLFEAAMALAQDPPAASSSAAPSSSAPPPDATPPWSGPPRGAPLQQEAPVPGVSPRPTHSYPYPWPPYPPPPFPYGEEPEEPATERYYGWQNATVDGIGLSLFVTGVFIASDNDGGAAGGGAILAGIGTYALGPPIVHWAHGHVGKGFGSLAMRLTIPPVLTLLGWLTACTDGRGDAGCIIAAYTGWQVGILIPPILDSTVLGWEKIGPNRTGAPSLRVTPSVSHRGARASLGFAF